MKMEGMSLEEAFEEANKRITVGQVAGTILVGTGVALSVFEPLNSGPTWIHESVSHEDAIGTILCFAGAGLVQAGHQFRQSVQDSYRRLQQLRDEA